MDDLSPLDRHLAESNSPSLVDARPTERRSEDPSEYSTIHLPYRFALVTPSILGSPPAQGVRINPDAKLFQEPDSYFVPPARPSSTPYPFADTREAPCPSPSEFLFALGPQNVSIPPAVDDITDWSRPATHFTKVPVEVHETILDHLVGVCAPVSLQADLWTPSAAGGLGRAPRSSRRRETTQLALINATWRVLVQKRLYRHIKLKGTLSSIHQAISHFAGPGRRLANYVKHIEIWFPVFQPRYPQQALSPSPILPVFRSDGALPFAVYTLPGDNCTLRDVFQFVSLALPRTKILTLEGGERRKAPKVVHSPRAIRYGPDYVPILPVMSSVTTLVTKGQWNLMRDCHDFVSILSALPNLEEWRGAYSKPKSKSYISLSQFLPYIPASIKHLSLCLENDYRREAVVPAFFAKASHKAHICTVLAKIAPGLERLSYTGRVCHQFFQGASQSAFASSSRLRSIDLTIKNCCRHSNIFSDSGSGIQDKGFIAAFERLVISAVKSLAHFHRVEYMRIRFVDLDSAVPGLNPYFLFQHGECSGVWSDKIINEMAKARPGSKFSELSESFGNVSYTKEGRLIVPPELSRTRMTSMKISNYEIFENRVIAI